MESLVEAIARVDPAEHRRLGGRVGGQMHNPSGWVNINGTTTNFVKGALGKKPNNPGS